MTLSRGSIAAPAVSPVVGAAGGGGRNSSGLVNPEFAPTIPVGDGFVVGVGSVVVHGSDALIGPVLAHAAAQAAARRAAHRLVPAPGGFGDVGRQLRNRAEAASRLPGGDPRTAELRREDSAPTSARLAAWSAAIADLNGGGFTPIVPASIARDLWRNGGTDRDLMARVYRAGGIAE